MSDPFGWLGRLFRAFRDRDRRERDLDDEFQSHVEMETARHVATGVPPEEARRRALLAFGGVDRFKEEARDGFLTRRFDELARDLRFGLRVLRRSPGFTFAALVTLALGTGGSAAMFGAVRGMLLQPLPYRDAGDLVFVWQRDVTKGRERLESSPANFLDWRERSRSFQRLSAAEPYGHTWRSESGPVHLPAWQVYERFFDLLGARPLLGRTFHDEDHRAGRGNVLVLGYRIWKSGFGGDPAVVGRTIEVDGAPWTVIGVMPESFAIPGNGSVWSPKVMEGWEAQSRAGGFYTVIGRLGPGFGIERASAEMDALAAALAAEHPTENSGVGVTLVSFEEQILGPIRGPLLVLLGAVVLVFLIAGANLANLQLARAIGRRHEFAMRTALGAPSSRLMRQLLAESALLTGIGGLLGVALAVAALEFIRALAPPGLPRASELHPDGWVLAFSILGAAIAGGLTGVVPIGIAFRASLRNDLSSGSRTATAGRTARRMRDGLVVAQIALSLVLVIGAGLLIRSFALLLREERGFHAEGLGVLVVHAWDEVPTPEARIAFVRAACARMRSLPGVSGAAVASVVPIAEPIGAEEATLVVPGLDPPGRAPAPVDVNTVTPDYFATAGVPLRRGRGFSPADRSGGAPVTLISEGLARRSFGDRDPVGTRIALTFHGRTRDLEVVGVVGDVRRRALSVAPHPTVYLPFDQAPTGANAFFVRAGRDAEAAVRGARVVLGELLPGTSVARAETMDRVVGESVRERRFVLTLIGLFAVLALALASVGTFGVMSYSTAERTREIGVRMAFGAWGRDVILMVLGRGVRLAAAGIALGLLGALLLSRQLTGMLYEVRPLDAATFATSAALLFGAAIAACWLPAARAARLDPMDALRAE